MALLKAAGMVCGALSVVILIGGSIIYFFLLRPQDKKRKNDQFKNLQNS
jgi:preprotein translocase subunit YajC